MQSTYLNFLILFGYLTSIFHALEGFPQKVSLIIRLCRSRTNSLRVDTIDGFNTSEFPANTSRCVFNYNPNI